MGSHQPLRELESYSVVTGEIIELEQSPASLVVVQRQCDALDLWAERCDDIAELRDASHMTALWM
jgi:hypothetical protein